MNSDNWECDLASMNGNSTEEVLWPDLGVHVAMHY